MSNEYAQLLPVVAAAALVPIAVGLMPERHRLPQVVLLLGAGIVIGPEVLAWSSPDAVRLLSDLGLGFVFLLAGYELDPLVLRRAEGRLGVVSWFSSVLIAAGVIGLFALEHDVTSAVAVAIALTTTALGVLLPVLEETGIAGTPLGRYVFASGAVGELGPIVAMALLLGARQPGVALVTLVLFGVLVAALALLPGRIRLERVTAVLLRSQGGSGQSTVRLTVALLVGLLALSAALGFDAVLGAFLAGMVLRRWGFGDVAMLERKLTTMGWGLFIPVFFISSGMGLDIRSIAERPLVPLGFLVLMLAVRGGPQLFWYRRELPRRRDRVRLALFSSTALPLLVALTELAVGAGTMSEESAATLVGAGAASVLVFPYLATRLGRDDGAGRAPSTGRATGPDGEPAAESSL